MTDHTHLTADQARAALAGADATSAVSAKDTAALSQGMLSLGVVLAALPLALRAFGGNQAGLIVTMAVYAVCIAACTILMSRARSVPRGFAATYGFGLAASGIVAMAGIMTVSILRDHGNGLAWPWVALFALGALVPALVASRRIATLGR